MAVVAFRRQTRWCWRRVQGGGRVIGDFDVVEEQRVGLTVVEALDESDSSELVRVETLGLGAVHLADEGVEGQAQADPFPRGKFRQRTHQQDRGRAYTLGVIQVDPWRGRGGEVVGGVTPDKKIAAGKFRNAVAGSDEQGHGPVATGFGSPLEAQ